MRLPQRDQRLREAFGLDLPVKHHLVDHLRPQGGLKGVLVRASAEVGLILSPEVRLEDTRSGDGKEIFVDLWIRDQNPCGDQL